MPTRKKAALPVLPEFSHLRVRMRAVTLGSGQYNSGDIIDTREIDEETSDIGLRQFTGLCEVLATRANNHPPVEAGNLDADGRFFPVQVAGIALIRTAEEWDAYSPRAQKLSKPDEPEPDEPEPAKDG